jgi:hypothetical protein
VIGAGPWERTDHRLAQRNGSRPRTSTTTAGISSCGSRATGRVVLPVAARTPAAGGPGAVRARLHPLEPCVHRDQVVGDLLAGIRRQSSPPRHEDRPRARAVLACSADRSRLWSPELTPKTASTAGAGSRSGPAVRGAWLGVGGSRAIAGNAFQPPQLTEIWPPSTDTFLEASAD